MVSPICSRIFIVGGINTYLWIGYYFMKNLDKINEMNLQLIRFTKLPLFTPMTPSLCATPSGGELMHKTLPMSSDSYSDESCWRSSGIFDSLRSLDYSLYVPLFWQSNGESHCCSSRNHELINPSNLRGLLIFYHS